MPGSSAPPQDDYAKPPIVEVVFAVAIGPLQLSVVDLARFGLERLGDDFPIRTEQPPMQMPVETFDRARQMVMPTLALLSGPPPVRLWFQSEDMTRLVQVQRDWLACNWQAGATGAPYPRYEANEASFYETWDSLSEFVESLGQGPLTASQCELTYVNHITPGELWSRHGEMSKVIRLAGQAGAFLPEPEDGHLVFRYRMSFEDRDAGRLYVQATPAVRPEDPSPVIQLQLVARGAPLEEGRDGMVAFFRLAHKWIVEGFAAVTTDESQISLWERKQ
jgi:uncharacterized protein (TIGR04255 family)